VCLVFCLPLVSLGGMTGVATAIKLSCLMLVLLAALWPVAAVLLLPALLALSLAIEMLGVGLSTVNLSECAMLAFAAGGMLRLGRLERDPRDRLSQPALVLGLAIAAFVVVALGRLHAIAPARPLLQEVWEHVTRDYWHGDQPLRFLHDAMRWLACLATAVVVERALRRAPRHADGVVRMWLLAAGVAGSYAALRLVEVIGRRGEPVTDTLRWVASSYRIAAFSPDPNATGSYFAIFLTALALLVLWRAYRVLALLVTPFVLVAFAVAQSRAAIGAVVVTLSFVAIRHLPARRRVAVAATVAVLGAVVLIGGLAATRQSHAPMSDAFELRQQMTVVAARMAARYPMFGVGLGNYPRVSVRFMSEDQTALLRFAPAGENAHNNFLQILVELGVPAFVAFLWLVLPVAWAGLAPIGSGDPSGRDTLAAGVAAFLMTALFGHPLLVPQVAMAFFLTLGIAASGRPLPSMDPKYARWLTWAGAALFLASLLWRVR